MKHRKAGKKLNRNGPHRLATRRNLAASLFLHGKVFTSLAKAKDCRPFAEKLITRARMGTLHDRRIVAAKLNHPEAERKLFQEIAESFRHRSGGYTSIHRLSGNRLGDNGSQAVLEIVHWEPGEKQKSRRRRKPSQPRPKPKTAPETPTDAKTDDAEADGETKSGDSGPPPAKNGAGEETAPDARA